MAELDEVDTAFLKSLIPDDAIVVGPIAVAVWLDENGTRNWRVYTPIDESATETVGLLELAKLEVIHRSSAIPSLTEDDD